jgi:hypothetical protein
MQLSEIIQDIESSRVTISAATGFCVGIVYGFRGEVFKGAPLLSIASLSCFDGMLYMNGKTEHSAFGTMSIYSLAFGVSAIIGYELVHQIRASL